MNDDIGIRGTVVLVKESIWGDKEVFVTENIVTNDGDVHYAQRATNESEDNLFTTILSGTMVLGTAGDSPAKASNFGNLTTEVSGSRKTFDSTYPQTNDSDGDNPTTGADVVSFRVSYGTSEANASGIDRVMIGVSGVDSGNPILMYATFGTSVNKTSSDTLKVFVNHTMNGV